MAKKRRPMAEMNVVPYINVMLVLLVIFMVTAPLLKQGVDVALPVTSSEPLDPSQDEPILININQTGQLFSTLGDAPEKPVSLDVIQQQISIVLEQNKATPVLIGADHRIDYGQVMKVMTALKSAGVPNVGLLTEPPVN